MAISDYRLSYEISPIMLVGGIAGTNMLPLINILSSQNFSQGVLSSASGDDYFGHFRVLPGHSLMENEVALYPLANQSVAAIITDPLRVSLEMIAPANDQTTVAAKLAIMTSLKSSLDNHTALGGWYNVSTPSYIYQGCLLTSLTEGTEEDDGSQVQIRWIWNFMQPLLTAEAAQAAQNQGMSKISSKTQNSGDPPGSAHITTAIGQPSSNITPQIVPAASGSIGSNVAPSGAAHGTPSPGSVSPIAPGG
jgi:hypothetical protein